NNDRVVSVAIRLSWCEKTQTSKGTLTMIRCIVFIFALLLLLNQALARDEKSIKDLSKALVVLAPNVDPGEAERLSVTAHTTARKLAREYHVVLKPEFQAFLVNVGARKRGWCGIREL